MKKFAIVSLILSILSFVGTIYQNFRLASMYREAYGKTKAMFGIIELRELDIKISLGFFVLIGLVLGIIAIRKKENKTYAICAISLNVVVLFLLFVRIWIYLI